MIVDERCVMYESGCWRRCGSFIGDMGNLR